MTDVIVVGAGLSGLVAAGELVARGKHVTILEQEPHQSLGGQAHWSFGGLFFVDSPEQRRLRIHDSLEKDTPVKRAVEQKPTASAKVISMPRIGGLHHRYAWREAA